MTIFRRTTWVLIALVASVAVLSSVVVGAPPTSATATTGLAGEPASVRDEEGSGAPAAVGGFSDVPRSHVFWQPITWLVARNFANGYADGTFRPTPVVTRQAIAAFLYRYYGSPQSTCTEAPFTDVPVSHPFCKEIKWLAAQNITRGYADGSFHPTDAVARQAVAAMLYRAEGSPDGAEPSCVGPAFIDVPAGHAFCGEIKWLTTKGIAEGYADGTFRPSAPVSRQGAAAFLHRYRGAPVKVVAGQYFNCAVLANGTVRCWGANDKGQLGDGTTADRAVPVLVSGITDAVDVSATHKHACAVRKTGRVVCWGENSAGQLGDGSTTDRWVPTQVVGLTSASKVSVGFETSCAVLRSGAVKCWGSPQWLKLTSAGPIFGSEVPIDIAGVDDATDVRVGGRQVCALRKTGRVTCWGYNMYGQIGDGTTTNRGTPVAVGGITTAVTLNAGDVHVCVVLASATVRCWGRNGSGQIGDGSTTDRLSPTTVGGTAGAVDVGGDYYTTCAVLTSGEVKCWGDNANGGVGNGTQGGAVLAPVTVSALSDAIEVSAGLGSACSLSADAKVRCWGRNDNGEVGDGSYVRRLTPVGVFGLS